jgi:SAM-dependent methyltransferase
MTQTHIIIEKEADAWFDRNRDKMGKVDRVSEALSALGIRPTTVIEIGCANGWRLKKLEERFHCRAIGIEPSRRAANEGRQQGVHIKRATAEKLPIHSTWCDLLIYGFCLYLADPGDWLKIAAEGDRILAPGGYLVIHDFKAESPPYFRQYRHREDIVTYHYDFARLWLGNPLYRIVASTSFNKEDVTVLQKSPEAAVIKERE